MKNTSRRLLGYGGHGRDLPILRPQGLRGQRRAHQRGPLEYRLEKRPFSLELYIWWLSLFVIQIIYSPQPFWLKQTSYTQDFRIPRQRGHPDL